jgi:predicted metallo-beta-lactamase superfamily hydrolase
MLMLKRIRVAPLAAESFGVRSMCTYAETPDVRILLDAGVSLCPNRFGLPPHPKEFKAIDEARRKIAATAKKAEIVTISHYHNDHHTPAFEDWLCNWTEADETARQIYEGKTVLAKNPKEQINYSQRERGWMFQKTSGKYARKVETADGKTFVFNQTKIKFSEPVSHGPENSGLGWVLMITIDFQDERFLFAPDVQGPMSERTLETILGEKPQLIMIGGPPSYLMPLKVGENQIQTGLKNLETIAASVPVVILEHHILRDENWQEKTTNVFYSAYKSGHTIQTAAEFVGKRNVFLEACRKRLFADDPPSKEFKAWMRLGEETRRHVKPPVET